MGFKPNQIYRLFVVLINKKKVTLSYPPNLLILSLFLSQI